MPSLLHETLIQVIKDFPVLARHLLMRAGQPRRTLRGTWRVLEAGIKDLQPPERQPDLVLGLTNQNEDRLILVVEVQLEVDPDKVYLWPYLTAALHLKYRCEAVVVVIAPDEAVGDWARQQLVVGPGHQLRPLVLGPSELPPITDPAEAAREPYLCLLCALMHCKGPEALAVGQAALQCLPVLPSPMQARYEDLLLHLLGPLARTLLESLMLQPYEFKSELARERYEAGVLAGVQQGVLTGRQEGLLTGRQEMLGRLLDRRFGAAAVPLIGLLPRCSEGELLWLADELAVGAPLEVLLPGLQRRLEVG